MRKISLVILSSILLSACVSKKKYVALEHENGEIKSALAKTEFEKEELESKFSIIEARVEAYNTKINALTAENEVKMESVGDVAVISNEAKRNMRKTLAKMDPSALQGATTLKDSMNLALSYNLQKTLDSSSINEDEDIAIDINETVVMISISDKMLFNSGSYNISSKANNILQKLANIINSEPSIEVMVEGHTDSQTISTDKIADNWDLSVLRATSVVRALQTKYKVAPEKLIASGRSSYLPVAGNDTKDNRAKNRRTRIVILPNIDKFFALMASND